MQGFQTLAVSSRVYKCAVKLIATRWGVMKSNLKTDEGWELNFVVIFSPKMRSNLDHGPDSVTSNL